MNWKIVWHQVAIALLIGFASGAAFSQWYTKEIRHDHHGKKGGMKQHMLAKLDHKLHLTQEQKTAISAIFDQKRPQMEAMRDAMKPKFDAMRETTDTEIRKVLNPDQQVKFDEFTAKMKKRWDK